MDLYEIHCNDTIDSLRVLIACWGVRGGVMARARDAVVTSQTTRVLPLEFNKRYPVLKRGDGVWVEDESGRRYLDAMSGGPMATLALTGRPGLKRPLEVYMSDHLHIPPSTWRFDPSGEEALEALDRALDAVGPETVSAYFCEPISAAALPAYTPPKRFWEGLAERREKYGFLICFDEIVTGIGRTGHWFAAETLPLVPDIIATAKGLGAGYAAIGAVRRPQHLRGA